MDETNYTKDGMVKEMRINAPSNKGLLAAIIFLFSPLLYVAVFVVARLANLSITSSSLVHFLIAFVAIFMFLLWAAGIVKCVSEIARYYSKTAEVGLFLILIAPLLWAMVGAVTMATAFGSFLDKISPYLS